MFVLPAGEWHATHRRSRIGWISRRKLKPFACSGGTPSGRFSFSGGAPPARDARKSGVWPGGSWQPMQLAFSPGWSMVQLRMDCTIRPFSSRSMK